MFTRRRLFSLGFLAAVLLLNLAFLAGPVSAVSSAGWISVEDCIEGVPQPECNEIDTIMCSLNPAPDDCEDL